MLYLPEDWGTALLAETQSEYYAQLLRFVELERTKYRVYPCEEHVFNAFHLTPLASVRVVMLGQDPYHGVDQAHGLCFSVSEGVRWPPSLVNIMKELATDCGCSAPHSGCLEGWAQQGVLLLNSVLTVREAEANSHRNRGWERFTDAVIKAVNNRNSSSVFLLWGAYAEKKAAILDPGKHTIISSPHPSPLSAHTGFFGSKPFSRANKALVASGYVPIEWCL